MKRRVIMAGMALASVATLPHAQAQTGGDTPQALALALAERFAATLSAHDIDAFAALFADDYVNHQTSAATPPPPPGKTMKQGSVAFFAARLAGMPDLSVAIEAMVATQDRVAASFVYTGTHLGPYFGVAPTGRKLRFTSCDIFTVRRGTLVEHWGMGDIAGTLAQLKA